MGQVTILRPGTRTTIQDLGREGYRSLGVSRGGALDLFGAKVINSLLGNPLDAAVLEVSIGGLQMRFSDTRTIAWCGGDFPVHLAGEQIPPGRCVLVRQEEELTVAPTRHGSRCWLALAGGIDVPQVLGSRSTDLRAGFGGWEGRALQPGDELSLGRIKPPTEQTLRRADWGAPMPWIQTASPYPTLRIVPGAEWGCFTKKTRSEFLAAPFTVTAQADRMGVRLQGVELPRKKKSELISEGVAPGTLQVAHDGQPILLLGDCQTIGGYPKIAHVITVDLAGAAQLQPNDVVRFQEISALEARALYLERENDLQRFRVGLALRAP